MGGTTFFTSGKGETADAVFQSLREQAQYDYGHAGYTGTIAEKQSFVMIPFDAQAMPDDSIRRKMALDLAYRLIDEDDQRISDKWGPAGCIEWRKNHFLFFGWASE